MFNQKDSHIIFSLIDWQRKPSLAWHSLCRVITPSHKFSAYSLMSEIPLVMRKFTQRLVAVVSLISLPLLSKDVELFPYGLNTEDNSMTVGADNLSLSGPYQLQVPLIYYLRQEYQLFVSDARQKSAETCPLLTSCMHIDSGCCSCT